MPKIGKPRFAKPNGVTVRLVGKHTAPHSERYHPINEETGETCGRIIIRDTHWTA